MIFREGRAIKGRRGHTWPVLTAALLLVLAAGCESTQSGGASAVEGDLDESACENVRGMCSTVVVSGQTVRYQLISPGSDEAPATDSSDVVLVDLGGPGYALFGNSVAMTMAATWPGKERLLFLEEPWPTQTIGADCEGALRELYHYVHEGRPRQPGALRDACQLEQPNRWGWSPDRYQQVVEAITHQEGLTLKGLVGSSYGAIRVHALNDLPNIEWEVINSPAPLGTDGQGYLTSRADVALAAASAACIGCSGVRGTEQLLEETRTSLALLLFPWA